MASVSKNLNTSAQNLPRNFGIVRETTNVASLQPIPLPSFPDDYILVETVAVAINPTDWTTLAAPGADGTLVGCDYAGTVLAVGPSVKKPLKIGDRVCGVAHGANDMLPWTGAFARFISVKGDTQIQIPPQLSWEEASTVGVATCTAGWALWKMLGLKMPNVDQFETSTAHSGENTKEWVLIYGGSTATGTVAIQLAKLSGYKVITTSSPKNFELLRDRGADVVLDYNLQDVGEQINRITDGTLQHVLDCVAVPSSTKICAASFGPQGGKYCSLLPEKCPREDVESIFFLAYSISGEPYIFESEYYEAQPGFFEFGKQYLGLVERLWAKGLWKAHPYSIREGGINGVRAGMREMEEGKVSGEKLVYRVIDSEWPGSVGAT